MDVLQIHWDMTDKEITDKTKAFIKRSKINNNKLVNFVFNDNTNTDIFIGILADDIAEYTTLHSMCNFLQYINTNLGKRANYLLTKYNDQLNSRKDVYLKIKQFQKYYNINDINNYDNKFILTVLKGFERSGINSNKEKLEEIKKNISKTENKIANFISDKNNNIYLNKTDIDGLENFFDKSDDKYKIDMTYSNYIKCMKYLNKDNVREEINKVFNIRYFDILEDISKLLVLRDDYAKLLNYKNYSDYINNIQLSENSQNIQNFLINDMSALDFKYKKELHILKKIKGDNIIYNTDIDHLIDIWKKDYDLIAGRSKALLDDKQIKDYFPIDHITKVILETYENLFDLKFVKINDAIIWHKDVKLYAIFNMQNKVVGYFYLDLLKRKNKLDNDMCFSLQLPSYYPFNSNNYQTPINALMFSFNKLLSYNEVVRFFHEFSHIVHCVFNKNKYCLFSGTNVQQDYAQTPAMVLEYICWEKRFIKKASCHYKNGNQLSDVVIDKMIAMRDIDIGIHYKKNILLAIYDQMIHSSNNFLELCRNINSNKDLAVVFFNLHNNMINKIIPGIENNKSLFPNMFFKYIWESPSQQYIYIWSKICAADIYHYISENRLSIKKIIGQNMYNSYNPLLTINNILGRKPSVYGLLKLHNLKNIKFDYTETDNEHNRFSEIDPEDFTETTESLARYKNLFINKNNIN